MGHRCTEKGYRNLANTGYQWLRYQNRRDALTHRSYVVGILVPPYCYAVAGKPKAMVCPGYCTLILHIIMFFCRFPSWIRMYRIVKHEKLWPFTQLRFRDSQRIGVGDWGTSSGSQDPGPLCPPTCARTPDPLNPDPCLKGRL